MELGTVLTLILGNGVLIIPLFLWIRSESRADIRHMDSKLESNRDLVRVIHEEMKYFHNRLCLIEERKKDNILKMTGKRIGYKRVSTFEQNPDSQLVGIELDKVFIDIETGYSTKNRHQLKNLKEYVREDDLVFIECMDRLGRNGYDLDELVKFLLDKGVQVNFVREGIILGKKNDIMSKLAYDMMKSFIHFFSQLAKERQRIGIEKAKKEGKYKGRKTKLTYQIIQTIKNDLQTRKSKVEIAKDLGISRFSLYRYIEKLKEMESIKT